MVHKPKHKVHSFRALLSDGGIDEINLERQNLNLAYRIVKFEIIPGDPTNNTSSAIMKIYKDEQSTATRTIDFSDPTLIGVALWSHNSTLQTYPQDLNIIFDNELFSRNIFITLNNAAGNDSINYYLELEEVPVSASALMQLKLGVARKLNLEQ